MSAPTACGSPAHPRTARGLRLTAALAASCACADVLAVDPIFAEPTEADRAGSGSVSISYHHSRTDGFNFSDGAFGGSGEIRTQAAVLELEYYLNNRWSLEAAVPFIKRRYLGPRPHLPLALTQPHPESAFLDDGQYHGGIQDFRIALRYDAIQDAFLLRPFVAVIIPSRDYTFFAQSAIGQNLYKGEIGAEVIAPLGLSPFYVRGIYAYEIVERSYEGTNTNHHVIQAELGWYATPELVVRGYALSRQGNGLGTNADFAMQTNERWYYHDQTQEHDSVVAGFGADYAIGDRYVVSLNGLRMVYGRAIHELDFSASVELTWHFGH